MELYLLNLCNEGYCIRHQVVTAHTQTDHQLITIHYSTRKNSIFQVKFGQRKGRQLSDNSIWRDHIQPNTVSEQLFLGLGCSTLFLASRRHV